MFECIRDDCLSHSYVTDQNFKISPSQYYFALLSGLNCNKNDFVFPLLQNANVMLFKAVGIAFILFLCDISSNVDVLRFYFN